MFVTKRDGRKEPVNFDKITKRIRNLCFNLSPLVDPVIISQQVVIGVSRGIDTYRLDELASETAASYTSDHPDYSILAARISISNLHKRTSGKFSHAMQTTYYYQSINNSIETREDGTYYYVNDEKEEIPVTLNINESLISDDVYQFICKHKEILDEAVDYSLDYKYDYFGYKTLERAYLRKVNGNIVERPQHMLMRVACGIHCGDLEKTLETYAYMSQGFFTHASPTLYNAGSRKPQMSSCFLMTVNDDSISGIYKTVTDCAEISKHAGGIGVAISKIRGKGSYIRGTNGVSNGIVPMLKVFNSTAKYVDQGGGKRKGAFAMYLEPWHCDIVDFLELRKNNGAEEQRARDLFYGLWVCDLFMNRMINNQDWSLFCPDEAPGLSTIWGEEFENKYIEYEQKGLARSVIPARKLMVMICTSQIETGQPYMLYKDACNRKSNQQHLGTIESSNLCTEITLYTSPDEAAVCNLASIALPKFVDVKTKTFRYDKLEQICRVAVRNLNIVIDKNFYPIKEAKNSNMIHRPIGIGVQGLADVFMLLGLPYVSDEAKQLNKNIFETMYYACLSESCNLAKVNGPYPTYEGSPISEGILQFDMWNIDAKLSGMHDWETLRGEIKEFGVRNSMLMSPMPTASTSQILGNTESFEPKTSNAYLRRTSAGEFVCFSKHLVNDLIKIGLWDSNMKNRLIKAWGSIQTFEDIPKHIRDVHKTVWEIKNRPILDMAADRGAFICQSQSMNVYDANPTVKNLISTHVYGWKKGLKTGMYYLRSEPPSKPTQFSEDVCTPDCDSCGA